jgi:myo-inositol catabolism protein IolC
MRPELVVRAIGELQAAGVEPDVWKVEGLSAVEDCRRVADAARAGGRDSVGCVVLGAGADDATVARWLRQAAGVEGFIGFAIGRTIFWNALRGWLAGRTDHDAAVQEIAANYRATVAHYAGAAVV